MLWNTVTIHHLPFTIPMQSHFPIRLILLWEYLRSSFRFIHKIRDKDLFILHNFVTLSGSVILIASNLNSKRWAKRKNVPNNMEPNFTNNTSFYSVIFLFSFSFHVECCDKVFGVCNPSFDVICLLLGSCYFIFIDFESINREKARNGSNGEWSAPRTNRKWERNHIKFTRASKRTSNFILS